MALIMGVAFAGLSIAIDSWQRGSRKMEELDARFALERLVQRQVALADPKEFHGDRDQLEFVSTYSLANGPGDPVRVKYAVDSGRFLYVEIPMAEYTPERSDVAVARSLGSFGQVVFRYIRRTGEQEPMWVDEWKQETGLPFAVRIQIGGDRVTIPVVNRK
jgi:hypothetical protein